LKLTKTQPEPFPMVRTRSHSANFPRSCASSARSVKWFSRLALVLVAPATLLAQTAGEKKKPEAKPTPKKEAKPATTTEAERINQMMQSVPEDQIFQGIQIPNYGPDGKLQSLFSAKSAKRIDDRQIEMGGLKIEIHNNDGTTFHVEMEHSVFNFDTNTLTSDTPTTIKRDDMIINGDRAEFHIKNRFGRVNGNVKMVIFNTGNTDDAPKRDKKASKEVSPNPKSNP
jgi:hypothetical protein